MKNEKRWKALVIGLCMAALTGCGAGAAEKPEEGSMHPIGLQSGSVNAGETPSDENAPIAPEPDSANGQGGQSNQGGQDGQGNQGGQEDNPPPDGSAAGVPQENQNDATANGTDGTVDANTLYTSAAMTGSVLDFSDAGCTVSVAVTGDDGKTSIAAAPGHESEDTNVTVTYQEDCVVQIATIYTSTGTAELEQASIADIKKQASVIVYGSYEDAHHVTATKIIICHRTA
nr:hypothetical protein [uncultured Acetatifactor sp.]